MHERKKALKSYGGLEKKYEQELLNVTMGSMALALFVRTVMQEVRQEDRELGDVQARWLNGPFQQMLELEHEVDVLVEKITADSEFSEKFKQMLFDEMIEKVKEGNRKCREIDAYVMSGVVPPGCVEWQD